MDKPLVKGNADLPDTLTPAQARKQMAERVAALVKRLNESENRLSASRARVANLVKNDATAKAQLAAFDSTVSSLRVMIESQKQQVSTLTNQIAALSAENATLVKDKGQLITEKEVLSTEKTQLLTEKNTVYYIVGTREDLVKIHVLEMTGGFLGLGRTAVPVRDLSPAAFTAIDRSQVTTIPFPLPDRSYRIVTRQDTGALDSPPADLNEFKGALKITNADKFWGASKYLIVVEN